jgi:hypothetical protein
VKVARAPGVGTEGPVKAPESPARMPRAHAASQPAKTPDSAWIRLFFGLAACSWMPHWACHYFRLETNSSFVVGRWAFSEPESLVSLGVYSALVLSNLVCVIAPWPRVKTAEITGLCHCAIGVVHAARLVWPFRFEILGQRWSTAASAREAIVVSAFGVLSLAVAARLRAASD